MVAAWTLPSPRPGTARPTAPKIAAIVAERSSTSSGVVGWPVAATGRPSAVVSAAAATPWMRVSRVSSATIGDDLVLAVVTAGPSSLCRARDYTTGPRSALLGFARGGGGGPGAARTARPVVPDQQARPAMAPH